MKKILSLILVGLIIFGLSACSIDKNNEPSESEKSPVSTTDKVPSSSETSSEQNSNTTPSSDMNNIKVSGTELYISYPVNMRFKKQSNSILFYNNNDSLVSLVFDLDANFEGGLSDVASLLGGKFLNDAATSSSGNLYGSSVEVTSSSPVQMANQSAEKFEGMASNDGNWDCSVYGYSFVINGNPCAVIGIVSAKEQDSNMIAAMKENVDKIASTIRTTE